MSRDLHRILRRMDVKRKTETLRSGGEVPPWVFSSREGTPNDSTRVQKAFKRALTKAKLPKHFHPHCLRHTFASLLL